MSATILEGRTVELARSMWAAGAPELEVAAACGLQITAFRRARRPGGPLESLRPRPHAMRDSGRRVGHDEVRPADVWRRAAETRLKWSPAEREVRSRGLLSQGHKTGAYDAR